MRTSESIGKIAEALAKAQGEMRAVAFDATNPHFRSKYATLSAIVDMARGPLAKHDICICQATEREETPQGPLMRVICRLAHKSGEWIEGAITVKPGKDDPQQTGSALTYSRRYLIASLLNLASDEDDDGNAATGKPTTQNKPASASKKPPEGKDTREVKPKTPGGVVGEKERAINLARAAAKSANVKDRKECFDLASIYAKREITDWPQATLEELAAIKAGFELLKEQENGKEAE